MIQVCSAPANSLSDNALLNTKTGGPSPGLHPLAICQRRESVEFPDAIIAWRRSSLASQTALFYIGSGKRKGGLASERRISVHLIYNRAAELYTIASIIYSSAEVSDHACMP